MSPNTRIVLRGAKFMACGTLIGATLGVVTFLPGELVATSGSPGGAGPSWPLAFGVAWACGRVGAVVGVIFYIIRRTLVGEVPDPCESMRERAQPRMSAIREQSTPGAPG
ncbi:MAG TPA: hypothetical protein PKC83_00850 [Gemmatimonadaceae bacterium]|nr:hypothetical protein [Gemmatimonadaceae bacterium]